MVHFHHRRLFLLGAVLAACPATLTGCGVLLHPERRGQVSTGQIDWKIAALDGLGLLLFFVPGVIAFAVDFQQGTIYLPAGHADTGGGNAELVSVKLAPQDINRERIEEVVSLHSGCSVDLTSGNYRSTSLRSIRDFWTSRAKLMGTALIPQTAHHASSSGDDRF